jgi:SAM-dependent methyltransferase
VITRPDRVEAAWRALHERLVNWMAGYLPAAPRRILEVGCGRGQITIPLAERFSETSITAVDRFGGAYRRDRAALVDRLARSPAVDRVRVVRSDARKWLSRATAAGTDIVLSSEFLPELDAGPMAEFLKGCFRVTRPGGTTAHLFLSPYAHNARQRLVIEADSNPRWSRQPSHRWFSPSPSRTLRNLTAAGFVGSRVLRRPGGLRARGKAASILLRQWGVRPAFERFYDSRLRTAGLELPDWILAIGTRPF